MIMELQNAKLASESEFKDIMMNLQKTADDIQKRIAGTGIGKLGEKITVKELKAAFPQDSFTDEKAKKAGKKVYHLNKKSYKKIQEKSFDLAILEKSRNINAIKLNIPWSDLGSWKEISNIFEEFSFIYCNSWPT